VRARPFTSFKITPAKPLNIWCTGKDSNLRTSLGGTDLQSVGFNHSPTCAKTLRRCTTLQLHSSNPVPRSLPARHPQPAAQSAARPSAKQCFAVNRQSLHNQGFAKQGNQEIAPRATAKDHRKKDHYKPEKLRMECVGKARCAASESAACRKFVLSSLALLGISAADSRFAHARKPPQPGAGEGNRTPDPLITNQMLYRLSYASTRGQLPFRAQVSP
jgi:hypothetical protein